jgi:hypothetical protein
MTPGSSSTRASITGRRFSPGSKSTAGAGARWLQTITLTFLAGPTPQQHTYVGALLYDLMNHFGPKFDPDVKNDFLRFHVSATGSDEYQAIVSWGELDLTSATPPCSWR